MLFRKLDGKRVALEGFMYAGNDSADKVSSFEFVYNIQFGGFHGPPRVQERVFVTVPGNNKVPVETNQVRIIGTLHVHIKRDPDSGKVEQVFSMELDHVEQM